MKNAINPARSQNYSLWYQEVIKGAELAEHSVVKGSMIIKPWGYGIWEKIQEILNIEIKKTGHQNVYFPMFIPLSLFEKEAQHIEGFAKECAIVTHTKLKQESNKLTLDGKLEEPLIVRPTSEMIIGNAFAKWIHSYRDLPLKINQWANIVRLELRPRFFLRTTEFLWQEGHTAHASEKEAFDHTLKMLDVYFNFAQNYLAMPVIKGEKPDSEKFPGAVKTFSIEAMMQDKKALQAGTSHFLGQKFSKASDIKFENQFSKQEFAWTSSWGVSTRLIGGLIMTHSDDDGLVLPPKIAPAHIVILPIYKEKDKPTVLNFCKNLQTSLQKTCYDNSFIDVILDDRDMRGGEKKWHWIKKGIPIRIEVGMRDIEKDSLCMYKRIKDEGHIPNIINRLSFIEDVPNILRELQDKALKKALDFREKNIKVITSKQQFYDFFKEDGFALCNFCMDEKIEKQLKNDLSVTIRCIPFDLTLKDKCFFSNAKEAKTVIFAKSY